MELTILQEDLNRAVVIASRFVSSRPALPILSHLMLKAKNGQLQIAATNLEIGINFRIGANIKHDGETTVPARALGEIISSLPKGRVEITQKEEMVNLSASGYSIELMSTPPNDLPPIPDEVKKGLVVSQSLFRNIAKNVVFAAAPAESRPEYSGVLFSKNKNGTDVVATDGVRLSRITTLEKLGEADRIFVPAGVVSEVPKIFELREIKVFLDQEQNQILFGGDKAVLTARLLALDFPDYEKIIPPGWETRVTLEKDELLSAIQIGSIFAQDHKVEFVVTHRSVALTSENPQIGSQKSTINAKVEGEEIPSIAFNWRYIREFLGAVEGHEVVIELTNPASPGVFRDPKDESFLHLIMPIKISE